ncbi:nucleotidyltransferase domain-containing protein [Nitratifractor salsuginis]|uniref:Polymerase beta nucleotidyltransferase domain-containing protein n=1 Tax=Nitratifractor salsuginis (strain DSM 16511 / JCM 12458 / E9I37-1) TaxID=749222 RepID=E6X127_NITSE|nr:nucleotidyltransferase domain-containing protein [Nitratifractor salsuginis]ADV45830.1 hypothetical protein Nitsa_0562 [Nitratifractor salsuginis DSM 16511]
MKIGNNEKRYLISMIREKLSNFSEVERVIVFGSFLHSPTPHDIDIAVIQNSQEDYLSLSLKYRKVLRQISRKIPLDILPVKTDAHGTFMREIQTGESIYER